MLWRCICMGKKKKQIFISYRRDGGEFFGKILHDKLTDKGYNVFFDVESLRSGLFDEQLYEKIDECNDFLLILSPNALDRCINEGDWVKNEIAYAIKQDKNIVPVLMRGFEWPDILPSDLEKLPTYQSEIFNSVSNSEHLDASVNVLCGRLLKSKPDNNNKKYFKYCLFGSLLFCLFIAWPKDDVQQQNFELARQAYQEMDNENYEIALQKFYLYQHGHSDFYWWLLNLINKDNEYSSKSIDEAIAICEQHVSNKE